MSRTVFGELDRFTLHGFEVAFSAARLSKYPGTKVGAAAMRDGRIIATGTNGYPRGACDAGIMKLPREEQLKLTIHAEENCIHNAAREGVSLFGATMYVTHICCGPCRPRLIQAGIQEVWYASNPEFEERWSPDPTYLIIRDQLPINKVVLPHSDRFTS